SPSAIAWLKRRSAMPRLGTLTRSDRRTDAGRSVGAWSAGAGDLAAVCDLPRGARAVVAAVAVRLGDAECAPDEHGARRGLERSAVAQAIAPDGIAEELLHAPVMCDDDDRVPLIRRTPDVPLAVERDPIEPFEVRVLGENVVKAEGVRGIRRVARLPTEQPTVLPH